MIERNQQRPKDISHGPIKNTNRESAYKPGQDIPEPGFGSVEHGLFIAPQCADDRYETSGLPAGTIVGKIDFVPLHNNPRVVLSHGIRGLKAYFEEIDEGLYAPDYLVGSTKERMAKRMNMYGFTVYERTRDDGTRIEGAYHVVGKLDTVREKIVDLTEKIDASGKTFLEKVEDPTRNIKKARD